jgi:pimeloyl-ACP methyl ester carboxylesterase
MAYTSRYSQHVRSLVFVDSAAPKLGEVTQLMDQHYPERIGEWRAKRATLGKHVTAADVAIFQSMEFVDDVALREFLDAVKDHRSNMDVNNQLRKDMANRDYWPQVRQFPQPTLVVHGRWDAVIAPSNSWSLHQELPNSRFQIIEAAGHLPHIERPQEFLAAVKPFLETLDRAAVTTSRVRSGPGALRLGPCVRADIKGPAKCGTFTVWENRDAKSGRTIDLSVVILEATGPERKPDPVLVLMGGPGESATRMVWYFDRPAWRRHRDVLLVDQRGTGHWNPLSCQPAKNAPLEEFVPLFDVQQAQACPKELEKHADLRYYLSTHAMDDLDELRAALGYQRVNLNGGSQGTLSALVYIRRHPEHVRSATLWATTALGHPMPSQFPTDTEGALQIVLRDCAAEATCRAAFPALDDDYRRAVRQISDAGSVRTEVRDPRTGAAVSITLRATDFAESLRAMLYSPETARKVPLLLHHAATTGDYRPFAQFQIERNIEIAAGLWKGLYFAQTCTQDVARVDPEAVYAAGRGTFIADHRARPHIEGCKGWPLGRLPAGFGEEVESDVPVLMINGEADPATPPTTARLAASRLSNARLIVVPQGGHSPVGLVGSECLDGIMTRFLETADPKSLDTACVANVRRKPWVLKMEEL